MDKWCLDTGEKIKMGMKNNTVVDRKRLNERNKIVENIANELYEAQVYFPSEVNVILNRCGWTIMGENTQGKTIKVGKWDEYVIVLNACEIEDLDELVEVFFHELAHVKLHDFTGRETATIMAKQEKEAVAQTTKWFNLYYLYRKADIKS